MTVYFLDTCIVLDMLRAGPVGRTISGAYGLEQPDSGTMISKVTVGELESVAMHRRWSERKRKDFYAILDNLSIVDIGHPSVILTYAEIDIFSLSAGRTMGKNDVWIAATAAVMGTTLLTSDRDFRHLFGTRVNGILLDAGTGLPI
jgi:tRNA(fMet)-specific endonuclease VapC